MHCDKLFFKAHTIGKKGDNNTTTKQQNKFLEARDAHALKKTHFELNEDFHFYLDMEIRCWQSNIKRIWGPSTYSCDFVICDFSLKWGKNGIFGYHLCHNYYCWDPKFF